MAIAHYYVSAARGSDTNPGTSPELAWATLDYAASRDYSSHPNGADIHVAPGVYRETVVVDYAGAANRVTRFLADPLCLWFPDENPGRVRITDANSSEHHPNGTSFTVITCNRDYVEFHEFYIDASYRAVQFTAQGTGRALHRCTIFSRETTVLYGSLIQDCVIYSSLYALRSPARAVDCKLFGLSIVVFLNDAMNSVLDNCTLLGPTGVRAGNAGGSLTCRNCIALNCSTGFYQTAGTLTLSNCRAVFCQTSDSGTLTATSCYASGCGTLNAFATGGGTELEDFGVMRELAPYVAAAGTGGIIGQGSNAGPAFAATDVDISRHRLRLRGGTVLDIGPTAISSPTDLPGGMLDWTTYHGAAPSVKIVAAGDVLMQVPATAGEALRVAVWVRHDSLVGSKPQIVLRGASIAEQTATATVADATWEQLAVVATPTIDEVLTLVFRARNSAGTCRFSDPEVNP
jgi:hypothetical protein